MGIPYTRAPHQEGSTATPAHAPNAALLIDFDNVTMGMRSDLSRELKTLLNTDVIKGKVTVQRAYADWRRYPQYIVPLSEASVDLIFAPAYGSSKKNATDIRMAIDALELIFIRPEIGTFILLTGDSDFSSLVLKLKEYGKYVIGVGIQESSSDILVQNCDEYYSYTSLTGLRKTTEGAGAQMDPWVLVEKAVERMESRDDVMRSDRLKQVMLELDPNFDEGNYNFSKFSRFLTEAASRKLVSIRKMENGQYEIHASDGSKGSGRSGGGSERASSGRAAEAAGSGGRKESRSAGGRDARGGRGRETPSAEKTASSEGGRPLESGYDLLRRALRELTSGPGDPVRDSDVKRKMLAYEPGFDESELGFSKFSRFLRQAHDHEVVVLRKRESGNYEVALKDAAGGAPSGPGDAQEPSEPARAERSDRSEAPEREAPKGRDRAGSGREADAASEPSTAASEPSRATTPGRRLGPRRGDRDARRGPEGPPPLLPGQVVGTGEEPGEAEQVDGAKAAGGAPDGSRGEGDGAAEDRSDRAAAYPEVSMEPKGWLDPDALGLPTEADATVRYLSNSYSGVGEKTAETLVNALGEDLFPILHSDPDRVRDLVPASRADRVLEGWHTDYRRRLSGEGVDDDYGEASVTDTGGNPGGTGSAGEDVGGGGEEGGSSNGSRGRRRTRRSRRGRSGS